MWGSVQKVREQSTNQCCRQDVAYNIAKHETDHKNSHTKRHIRFFAPSDPSMPLANKLDRKLRAAEESSDGEDYYEVTDRSSSESVIDGGVGGDVISSGDEDDEAQEAQDDLMVSYGKECAMYATRLTVPSQMHPTTTMHKLR